MPVHASLIWPPAMLASWPLGAVRSFAEWRRRSAQSTGRRLSGIDQRQSQIPFLIEVVQRPSSCLQGDRRANSVPHTNAPRPDFHELRIQRRPERSVSVHEGRSPRLVARWIEPAGSPCLPSRRLHRISCILSRSAPRAGRAGPTPSSVFGSSMFRTVRRARASRLDERCGVREDLPPGPAPALVHSPGSSAIAISRAARNLAALGIWVAVAVIPCANSGCEASMS